MVKAILFDLDGTLVNTECLKSMRDARKWRECSVLYHKTNTYPGIQEVLTDIIGRNIKVGIVTASVSFYAEGLLKHHSIHYDALIAYHDTVSHKPNPQPFLRVLQKLNLEATEVIGIGDGQEDAIAMQKAGIKGFGAAWSNTFQSDAPWHEIIATVEKLRVICRKIS